MEILLYSSAIIAAISLLLIAIFVIAAVKNAKKMMDEVSATMARMENKISSVTTKSDQLMERTNQIAADVEDKIQRLETAAQSAEKIGQSSESINRSFNLISEQIASPEPKHMELMGKLTTLTETASRIYFTFKSEKHKRNPDVESVLKQLPAPKN